MQPPDVWQRISNEDFDVPGANLARRTTITKMKSFLSYVGVSSQ